jgi:hypothetical protein
MGTPRAELQKAAKWQSNALASRLGDLASPRLWFNFSSEKFYKHFGFPRSQKISSARSLRHIHFLAALSSRILNHFLTFACIKKFNWHRIPRHLQIHI